MNDDKEASPPRRVSPAVERLQKSVAGMLERTDKLIKQTHLGRVLTYSAFLEEELRETITSHLVRKSKNMEEVIYDNNGPLSTFSGKIKIASAFGIISVELAAELHKIREIRNKCAHTRTPLTFETPEIIEEINKLSNARKDMTPEAAFTEAFGMAVRGLASSKKVEDPRQAKTRRRLLADNRRSAKLCGGSRRVRPAPPVSSSDAELRVLSAFFGMRQRLLTATADKLASTACLERSGPWRLRISCADNRRLGEPLRRRQRAARLPTKTPQTST
ncbi:MltR family transcriptional regulator [Mesorhizobium sp. ORM8.1]